MANILSQGVTLQEGRAEVLKKGIEEGLAFFTNYNEARLQLAFDGFDEAMRKALFEVLFLLHVNDPALREVHYTATRKDNSKGIPRYENSEETADLYIAGAPHGIKGIDQFSPVFNDQFRAYVQDTFGIPLPGGSTEGRDVFVCIQSIGSIGTIGHKSGASDLDLQVIFDLFVSPEDLSSWNDAKFRELLDAEHGHWVRRIAQRKNVAPADAGKPAVRKELEALATGQLQNFYPHLYKYLVAETGNYAEALKKSDGAILRTQLLQELVTLVKRGTRLSQAESVRKQEELLQERMGRIQRYIEDKFRSAEIYIFSMSLDMYRAGRYMSSLEFKESSGSAYELILNYETLMPGIQFSSTIPAHFLLPTSVNNDSKIYQRINDFIELEAMDIYQGISPLMVDLGNTPDLKSQYVAQHMPAAYWEAFKASSGNLPKATLNLLRFEMLIEPKFHLTIIQLIKEPKALDALITPRPDDDGEADRELHHEARGMPNWVLPQMEFDAPHLMQDPWWLRYKALKISFGEEEGVTGLDSDLRARISSIVDLAFALHVRISDVFTKPGDTRTFESSREQVLVRFLEAAFPKNSSKRQNLEHIFTGEVQAVSRFETELRTHFRSSLERTQKKNAALGMEDQGQKNQEVELWRQYYLEFFEPNQNVVQKTIMHHLKFPRGRLQIGFQPKAGWVFRSMQAESRVGKRFDTFGVLSHLPEVVTLIDGGSFLHGLATCIVNGYYGILNRGSLKETRTALEFDAKHMDLGNDLDNTRAHISPDYIVRMVDRILEFFPYEYHHYLDYIRVERKLDKVYIFLNLWQFGRISILYRDNLNTWYCDDFDHPDVRQDSDALCRNLERLLSAPSLNETIDRFMVNQKLFVDEVDLKTWVNPNSVDTSHSPFQVELKERELAESFRNQILKSHPKLNRAG